ncbi:hypothetical protein MRX96_036966 [Rhipicephalus microplus]
MESSSADDAPASDVDEARTPTPPLSPKDDCDSASVASSDHGDGASRDGFYANRATAFVDSIKAKYFSKSLRLGSGATLTCGSGLGTEKYKSKNAIKTLNPQWLEQFDLHMYTDQPKVLEITVWDKDFSGKGDFMGRCSIDLSSLEPETTHSVWQELEDGAGSLFLLLTISGSMQGIQLRLGPHRLRGHRRLCRTREGPVGAIWPVTQFLRLGRRRAPRCQSVQGTGSWPLLTWEARATLFACLSWSTRGCRRTPSTRRCHRSGTRYSASSASFSASSPYPCSRLRTERRSGTD